MKKKVCKRCRLFVEGNKCPACGSEQFGVTWYGRIYVIDAVKSEIAKKINIKVKGEYAIRVR